MCVHANSEEEKHEDFSDCCSKMIRKYMCTFEMFGWLVGQYFINFDYCTYNFFKHGPSFNAYFGDLQYVVGEWMNAVNTEIVLIGNVIWI